MVKRILSYLLCLFFFVSSVFAGDLELKNNYQPTTPYGSMTFNTSISESTFYSHFMHVVGVYYPVKVLTPNIVAGTGLVTYFDNDSDNEGSKFIIGANGSGVYCIMATVDVGQASNALFCYIAVFVNNTIVTKSVGYAYVTTTAGRLVTICQKQLNAGDKIAFKVGKRGTTQTDWIIAREINFKIERISPR